MMTSGDILELIKAKHSEDLVVPECRTGRSWSAGSKEYMIMDCWTAPHSWAHYHATAYEIKVSRQDFVQDNKWTAYLPYCHYFYFAAPPGVVNLKELPAEVGLYEASSNCKRLMLKKKAAYRQVEIPEEFYKYLLICRTEIRTDRTTKVSDRQYWAEWLKTKEQDRDFGWHVSQSLRKTIDDQITKVRTENRQLKDQIDALKDVRQQIQAMNLDPTKLTGWDTRNQVRDRLEEIQSGLPKELKNHIEQLERLLTYAKEKLCTNPTPSAGTILLEDSDLK